MIPLYIIFTNLSIIKCKKKGNATNHKTFPLNFAVIPYTSEVNKNIKSHIGIISH